MRVHAPDFDVVIVDNLPQLFDRFLVELALDPFHRPAGRSSEGVQILGV